ncbi:MAG: glutamate 5-kinase [Aggregatilineales bacterium]
MTYPLNQTAHQANPPHRIVIKLGTSVLTSGGRKLSQRRMLELARQIAHLHDTGYQIILVSSGAIAAGRDALNYPELHPSLPVKQMLAAVGQGRLIQLYQELFALFEIVVGQVLLTRGDIANRTGYLNARDTLLTLIDQRVLPIINENDTVATDEIRVGENDTLSALVANLIDADLLILLTDQQGLYTADPRNHPDATLIPRVERIDESVLALAGGASSGLGTGGMITKLHAAELAGRSGTTTVIASGELHDVLNLIIRGDAIGTTFPAPTTHLESRKRWLIADRPQGMLVVDDGAADRLCHGGASLLPVGMIRVEGDFQRGDLVQVNTVAGRKIGVGLSNYTSDEAKKLLRAQSGAIRELLGYTYGDEIVHRDNLALM